MSGRCINLKDKFSMLVILQGLSLFQQFETFYMYFDLNTYVQKKLNWHKCRLKGFYLAETPSGQKRVFNSTSYNFKGNLKI